MKGEIKQEANQMHKMHANAQYTQHGKAEEGVLPLVFTNTISQAHQGKGSLLLCHDAKNDINNVDLKRALATTTLKVDVPRCNDPELMDDEEARRANAGNRAKPQKTGCEGWDRTTPQNNYMREGLGLGHL